MSITGIGARSTLPVQSLIDMRAQLDDLQRQLGSGQKSESYAGVGVERGLAVGLRQQLSALDGYEASITTIGVRINLAQTALGRLADIGHDLKQSAVQTSTINNDGTTLRQQTALSELDEIVALLNTRAGDHYLFGGRACDQPPVETLDHILNGDGARAGFKQVLAERNQADLGADGLGRLTISSSANVVKVAEDFAGSPFGF